MARVRSKVDGKEYDISDVEFHPIKISGEIRYCLYGYCYDGPYKRAAPLYMDTNPDYAVDFYNAIRQVLFSGQEVVLFGNDK